MRTYIVFTKVKSSNNPNIYPNLVEARTWESAVEHVLEIRDKHEVIGVSNKGYIFETSTVDFQMFDAVKSVTRAVVTLGDYVKAPG